MTNFANLPKSLLDSATLLTEKSYEDANDFNVILAEYGVTNVKQLNETAQEEIYLLLKEIGVDASFSEYAKLDKKFGMINEVSNERLRSYEDKVNSGAHRPRNKSLLASRKIEDHPEDKKLKVRGTDHPGESSRPSHMDEEEGDEKKSEKLAIKKVPPISKVAVKAWQVVHAQQRGTYGKKTGLKQEAAVETMKDVKRNQMDEDVGEGQSPDPASGLKEGLRGDDQHETHAENEHHPKFEMKTEEASGTESSKRRKQHAEAIRKINEKLADTGLTSEDKAKARTELNFHKQQIKKLSGVVKKDVNEEPLELFKDRAKEIADQCMPSKKKKGDMLMEKKPMEKEAYDPDVAHFKNAIRNRGKDLEKNIEKTSDPKEKAKLTTRLAARKAHSQQHHVGD